VWKNIEQPDRPLGACALRAGYLKLQTLKICNAYYFSIAKMITRTRLNVIRALPVLFNGRLFLQHTSKVLSPLSFCYLHKHSISSPLWNLKVLFFM